MTPQEIELLRVLHGARVLAASRGPQHALWDVIFDAEALLSDKPTLLQYENRETAISTLIGLLRT